jgi:tRNA nucleotidyltransferase (CCA-adding enzyme)
VPHEDRAVHEAGDRARDLRCAQCGERLRRPWSLIAVKPTLCVDCAFEDLPHSDRSRRFGVGSSRMATTAQLLPPVRDMWEHFPHGADIGIRGRGQTCDQAFAEAARALTAVVTDLESVVPRLAVPIRCAAPDAELLLVEWLNAVIYEMATRRMLFGRFDVRIDDHQLVATAWGEVVDVDRHHPAVEPKGATMTALRVAHEADAWLAQTVLDV